MQSAECRVQSANAKVPGPSLQPAAPSPVIIGYSGPVRSSKVLLVSAVLAIAVAVGVFWVGGEDLREAIRVEENRVVVTNLGESDWSDVEVWLNDYYRAQAPRVTAGPAARRPVHRVRGRVRPVPTTARGSRPSASR